MAAKKKASGSKKIKHSSELKEMRLTGTMFHKYRAALAEFREMQMNLQLAEHKYAIEREKPIHRPLLILRKHFDEALEALGVAQTEFKALQAEVAGKFKIPVDDLSEQYVINQSSGQILFTPAKEEQPAQE